MRFIVDLHIHSRYSRATSKEMSLEGIAAGARKKGIDVVTCADFTQPDWFAELKRKFSPAPEPGLYFLKDEGGRETKPIRFILTTEVSLIYKKAMKTRRLHLVVAAPDLATVAEINRILGAKYNLKADGRPILGIGAEELMFLLLKINPQIMIIPAHIWTPWFALFGSKSGFDSFEECFGEQAQKITAVETGLSSDPAMNRLVSQIDTRTIISNSDAHSPDNLGREANVFCGEKISYDEIADCLRLKGEGKNLRLDYTIEFFPEEGKYHWDGHAACDFFCGPEESLRRGNICPHCGRQLVLGVAHRVMELADRKNDDVIPKKTFFKYIIPLREIIAAVRGVGKGAKAVSADYEKMIRIAGNEFRALLDVETNLFQGEVAHEIRTGLENMRAGRVEISPGYDGIYGTIALKGGSKRAGQGKLF